MVLSKYSLLLSGYKSSPDTVMKSNQQTHIESLRTAMANGQTWPTALLKIVAQWSLPVERYRGRTYNYFIAGEAFDWLLLSERLLETVKELIPRDERDDLLFESYLPPSFDKLNFKKLLGIEKYRGYLNYYYGITVEEALQLATELEAHKHHTSNGIKFKNDYTEEAFMRIYGMGRCELLKTFRDDLGHKLKKSINLTESKEFTYWLFKYRLRRADKARIASDTRKGLRQLRNMRQARSTYRQRSQKTTM